MEDTSTMEVLNLTRVKYTEAINYLDRQVIPTVLENTFRIDDYCDSNELQELADELGIELYKDNMTKVAILDVVKENYTLSIYAKL